MSTWLVKNTCRDNWKKKIHNNLRDLSSQKWRHLTNNLHNNLFVVIKKNYRTKLQSKTTTKWLVFSFDWKIQKMKKTKTILKTKRLPGFHSNVQFSWLNSNFNTSLISFLSSLPRFLKLSETLLPIYLNKHNGNIFQTFENLFFCYALLTCFWKRMPKTSSLEAFFQPKIFTTYCKFQCNNHGIEIKTFIVDIGNDFFPYIILIQQICQIFNQCLFYSFCGLEQANSFGC